MDFSSSLTLLTEVSKEYHSSVLKILEDSLKKFTHKYPDVVVGWTQSTEKDKEEGIWEFAVNDFQVFASEQDLANFDGYTTSYYSYENFLIDYPYLGEDFWDDWVSLESFLVKIPIEIFEDLFGQDAQVVYSDKGYAVKVFNHYSNSFFSPPRITEKKMMPINCYYQFYEAQKDFYSIAEETLTSSIENFLNLYPDFVIAWDQNYSSRYMPDLFLSRDDYKSGLGYESYYRKDLFIKAHPELGEKVWNDWVNLSNLIISIPDIIFKDKFGQNVRVIASLSIGYELIPYE